MDSTLKFYMERFQEEDKSLEEAQRKRQEWYQKEARHNENRNALLRLLLDRAQEVGEDVPQDLIDKGTALFGPNIHAAFKNRKAVAIAATVASDKPTNGTKPNTMEWIADAIAGSGGAGMTPPEILKAATVHGIKMHQNYPYVVLKKLVEHDRVVRKGDRYYIKGI